MAISGVAAAQNYAVGSALERLQYEHWIDAARTGHADYFNVCGIRKSAGSGKIGSGIRTPVAAESHDVWHELLVFGYFLHIASTSDMICDELKPLRSIAPDGHVTVHAPQPWHTAGFTDATLLTSVFPPPIRNSLST